MAQRPKDLLKYAEGLLGFPIAVGDEVRLTREADIDDYDETAPKRGLARISDIAWLEDLGRLTVTLAWGARRTITFDEGTDPHFWFTFEPARSGETFVDVTFSLRVWDQAALTKAARVLASAGGVKLDDGDVKGALDWLLEPTTLPSSAGFEVVERTFVEMT